MHHHMYMKTCIHSNSPNSENITMGEVQKRCVGVGRMRRRVRMGRVRCVRERKREDENRSTVTYVWVVGVLIMHPHTVTCIRA